MDNIQDPAPRAQDKTTFSSLFEDTRPSLILLGIIFVVSLIILAIIWWLDASHDSLGFELAKTCMQVAGVTVIGAIVGIATFTYQHKRERAAKDQDRRLEQAAKGRDQRLEQAAKDRAEQREEWRRDTDRTRDERRRQDELLRSVLEDTFGAYHAVKRTRRLLDAEAGPDHQAPVSFDAYDQYMKSIIDEQLKFEKLKLVVDLIVDSRLPRTPPWPKARPKDKNEPPLVAMFSKIEHSLHELVNEYKDKRYEVKQAGSIALAQLTKAQLFLSTDDFRATIADPKDDVVKLLQRALLEPVLLRAVRAENGDGHT